jgi:hypothetical protein
LIGIVFPAAALLLFALWRRDWRLLRLCRPLTGLLVLLAVCGPWVALLEYRNPGTLYYLVVNEHIKRVLGSRWPPDYEVVKVSALGYVGMTLVWAMPWSMLLWQVCRFSRKETASGAPDHVRHAVLLLALGALLPVVLFLPMPARLIYYSLPALAPFALLAAGWWSTAGVEGRAEGRLPAAACLMVLGAAVFSAGVWAADMVDDLPQLVGAPGMPHFVSRLAFLLGVGLLAGGALLAWRKAALALAALFVLLSAVQMYSLNGFGDYANVLSSKRLVEELRDKAGAEYTWVSEGSRELGAAAGIAYYLGLDAHGQARVVLVMEDDTRRPPPLFPGPKPAYLIDHERLNSLWSGAQPALFVTDVQRVDWEEDAPHLPEGELHEVPLPWPGQRRVYANKAAWQRLRP